MSWLVNDCQYIWLIVRNLNRYEDMVQSILEARENLCIKMFNYQE